MFFLQIRDGCARRPVLLLRLVFSLLFFILFCSLLFLLSLFLVFKTFVDFFLTCPRWLPNKPRPDPQPRAKNIKSINVMKFTYLSMTLYRFDRIWWLVLFLWLSKLRHHRSAYNRWRQAPPVHKNTGSRLYLISSL